MDKNEAPANERETQPLTRQAVNYYLQYCDYQLYPNMVGGVFMWTASNSG